MAFWGIEVKPGEPYIHRSDERGRLHVSQATIGDGSSSKKTILQCEVGNKKPIYLCSFLPKRLETCALNLEFEEDDEVTLSIVGSHSVHLSGFFYGDNEDQDDMEDDYEYGSDPYGEDIMGTDSEDEDDSVEYNSEDEDESDDYIGDDLGMHPSSTAPISGVRIEEIVDDEKPANENSMSKRAKKQKTQSSMSDNNENSDRWIVCKSGNGSPLLESEDEDGFPISKCEKMSEISKSEARLEESNGQKVDEGTQKIDDKSDVAHVKKLEGNIDAKGQDVEVERESTEPQGSSGQLDATITKNEVKQKKKNKKRKAAEKIENGQESGIPNTNTTEKSVVVETGNDPKPSSEKKKLKKKKKQNKGEESVPTSNPEGKLTDNNVSVPKKQEKEEAKSSQVRTFSNGLMIEELAMGKPDGKRASPGKRVSVHYIGKLKKNGKIFDSNIGRAPFKFRLGIGEVIKGWDVGVNGMRIGDKRKLTIPPAMGYGAKGAGGQIPPNSWLVFDVELVDVN